MAEQPNGDFAKTIVRQFLLSVYNYYLYSALSESKDKSIAAFAAKSLKEVAYHLRHSSDWVIRLGDGTEESHNRTQNAVDELWYFVDDMFDADEVDEILAREKIVPEQTEIKKLWETKVQDTFKQAGLITPEVNNALRLGSRHGNHTEHLGYILAEMQFLPRAYPDAKW